MSEKKMSEAQKKALDKYKANVKRLTVDFPPTDAELWEHIQKQPNKQGYIKSLIRSDMESTEIIDGECTKCGWFGDCVEAQEHKYGPGCGRPVKKG